MYLMQIYNRWGQLVFETQDIDVGWNGATDNSGELNQTDSYVYVINFQDET